MKFKVGDRIKVIAENNLQTGSLGLLGKIIMVSNDYKVQLDDGDYWFYEENELELIQQTPQHTLYNWRNYITFDIEVLQEKIDNSNSEMYRGFSEEEYEKIEEHNGTVEELLIWLSKGYVLLEAFAKEER